MPGFVGAREIPYDYKHQRARARAFAALPEFTACARGGHRMWKHAVEITRTGRRVSALHYDHNGQRTGYIGFSCADCNRKAGAAKGGRIATLRATRRRWQSRAW